MKSKYLILVEGKADIVFFRDYLCFLYPNLEAEEITDENKSRNNKEGKNKKTKSVCYVKHGNEEIIKIHTIGGYTGIKKIGVLLQEHMDNGYKILVIQDADNPDKQDGGVDNRMSYLKKTKKNLEEELETKLEFKTFLLPNHEEDGDLETLLLGIVNKGEFDPFFLCYQNYVNCSKQIAQSEQYGDELLEDKNIVFSYIQTYQGMKKAKEEDRNYNSELWNLEKADLEPLKFFFNQIIKLDNLQDENNSQTEID